MTAQPTHVHQAVGPVCCSPAGGWLAGLAPVFIRREAKVAVHRVGLSREREVRYCRRLEAGKGMLSQNQLWEGVQRGRSVCSHRRRSPWPAAPFIACHLRLCWHGAACHTRMHCSQAANPCPPEILPLR